MVNAFLRANSHAYIKSEFWSRSSENKRSYGSRFNWSSKDVERRLVDIYNLAQLSVATVGHQN